MTEEGLWTEVVHVEGVVLTGGDQEEEGVWTEGDQEEEGVLTEGDHVEEEVPLTEGVEGAGEAFRLTEGGEAVGVVQDQVPLLDAGIVAVDAEEAEVSVRIEEAPAGVAGEWIGIRRRSGQHKCLILLELGQTIRKEAEAVLQSLGVSKVAKSRNAADFKFFVLF